MSVKDNPGRTAMPSYAAEYERLKRCFVREGTPMAIEGLPFEFSRLSFQSSSVHSLDGAGVEKQELSPPDADNGSASCSDLLSASRLQIDDRDVRENQRFEYRMLAPAGKGKHRSAILLLHGLNETHWEKYLPWALKLCQRLGRPVILFPLAFHMNRAAPEWCRPREMRRISECRKQRFPAMTDSAFSNAAISARLHEKPERLYNASMQTCGDSIQLAHMLREGRLPGFDEGSSLHLFGYSIGAFLCLLLLLADVQDLFNSSRAYLFCGGPTLDRLRLAHKAILDSAAEQRLQSAWRGNLGDLLRKRCAEPSAESDIGLLTRAFTRMMSENEAAVEREAALRACAGRIAAMLPRDDGVVPSTEAIRILRGRQQDVATDVRILDVPYPYSHIMPFPIMPRYEADAGEALDGMMDHAAEHFS
jgi:pimeloyl-ACP methyl ester carboxylesterase